MSEEDELQEQMGQALSPYPALTDKRRLEVTPCINHGLDPDCGCTASIEVDTYVYNVSILYPGVVAKALDTYFINHPELLKGIGEDERNTLLNASARRIFQSEAGL